MPAPREWPAHEINTIREMDAAGATWADIAAKLKIARSTVISQAARMGLWVPNGKPGAIKVAVLKPAVTEERLPYPPGHAETWGVIVAGTCLEGAEYPR